MEKRYRERALIISLLFGLVVLLMFPSAVFDITGKQFWGEVHVEILASNETTNETIPPPPAGGSGGGSGSTAATSGISVSPSSFAFGGGSASASGGIIGSHENVYVGDAIRALLKIENVGDLTHNFKAFTNKDFITFGPEEFKIMPGEDVALRLMIDVEEPGISIAKISLISDYVDVQIPVVVNARSEGADFDVLFYMPVEFYRVLPGESLYSKLYIYKYGEGPVEVQYSLRDAQGKFVVRESDIFEEYSGQALERSLIVPESLEYGTYVFGVVVTHKGDVVSASKFVTIGDAEIHEAIPSPVRPLYDDEIILAFLFILCLTLVHYVFVKKQKGLNL